MTNLSVGVDYQNTSLMGSDQQFVVPNATSCEVELDIIDTSELQKTQKQTPTQVYSVERAPMEDVLDVDVSLSEGDVVADKILDLINNQKQIFDPNYSR